MSRNTCNQTGCENPGAYRFTWPGKDEQCICEEHATQLRGVAACIGLHLQLIRLDDEYTQAELDRMATKRGYREEDDAAINTACDDYLKKYKFTGIGYGLSEQRSRSDFIAGVQWARCQYQKKHGVVSEIGIVGATLLKLKAEVAQLRKALELCTTVNERAFLDNGRPIHDYIREVLNRQEDKEQEG